jgi:hypothetical protein
MPSPHRKFNLLDIVILVVVTGVGLGWYRAYVQAAGQFFENTPGISRGLSNTYWGGQWAPFLVSTTVAVFIFRLRPPLPAWRRLRRQPGWVACVSALSVALFFLAETFGRRLIHDTIGQRVLIMANSFAAQLAVTLRETGLAVAAAWMTLLLTGRWRAELSWIDRAGRILGVLWIGYFIGLRLWSLFVR